MKLTAIILAAGQSKRFGINKLLLPYKKNHKTADIPAYPLILYSLNTIMQVSRLPIVVVVGFQAKKIELVVRSYQQQVQDREKGIIEFILNKHYQTGMASSIRVGMKRVPFDSSAAMIVLGDQPCITAKTILLLIRRAQNSIKSIILPVYKGQMGHPVIFKKKYFNQLRRLYPSAEKRERGARYLLEKYQQDISYVVVNDKGILQDIDTWNDYHNLSK